MQADDILVASSSAGEILAGHTLEAAMQAATIVSVTAIPQQNESIHAAQRSLKWVSENLAEAVGDKAAELRLDAQWQRALRPVRIAITSRTHGLKSS